MATHSSILAWRIPWTEEPGGLQSMGRKESHTTEQRTLSDSKPLLTFQVCCKKKKIFLPNIFTENSTILLALNVKTQSQ